jgi:hypothetical protein
MIDPRNPDRIRRALRRISRPCKGRGDLGCHPEHDLDLVKRVLLVRRSGREMQITITLQRCAMVSLLRALLDDPKIQPWGGLSTYRSCEVQQDLWERYQAGGPLAAPPGKSWHNLGLAFDLYPRLKAGREYAVADREALIRHGWRPLGAIDPPHFEYRHR